MPKSQERIGEILVLSQVALYGLAPIVINNAVKSIEPIFFLALSTIISAVFLSPLLLKKKYRKEFTNKKAFRYTMVTMLFNSILAPIFIYTGSKYTSGLNTALLLQAEVLFTFLICGVFFGEKITSRKIIGAMLVVFGATAVILNGTLQFNWGDILIVLGTVFFPIGNIYTKKALKQVSSYTIIFTRALVSAPILLTLSFLISQSPSTLSTQIIPLISFILINGILLKVIAKVIWFEGLKRIDISKAVSIGLSYPAFALLYAMLLLNEVPTIYQLFGLAFIVFGITFLIRKHPTVADFEKVDPLN